jgi:hypothetical protein
MILTTLRAYAVLLSFEYVLFRSDFATLYRRVRRQPVRTREFDTNTSRRACAAIDCACVLYFKQVQCLQRSAATVCVLRRLGVPAELVIGAQPLPFRAHAWVEVQGMIVNDKASATETYAVLDRC